VIDDMTTTLTIAELEQSGERELGTSDWHEITQEQINLFAEATGDHQWIHVDPEAAANGPFGSTVAHGYLTLSMLPMLLSEVVSVSDAAMGLNYGTEKIRFTSPVPSGSRVRLHARLLRAERRGPSVIWYVGIQIEVEGKEKPALVGEVVYMAAGAPDA
jgi:acyl dehydratase